MPQRYFVRAVGVLASAVVCAAVTLQAAGSRQEADAFARKIATINQNSRARTAVGTRRTAVTESELNSWFSYRAQPLLPPGLTNPKVIAVGNGKLVGEVTVDLEAVGRRRSSGGTFDPWSLLGGRVPVNVTGVLHTKDGAGRFELQQADISGIPVPAPVLQELLSYYSRSDDKPGGIQLADSFTLPAGIRQIELGSGRAVVVQ